MPVIKAYKKIGETPVECLSRVRRESGIPENEPMTFAGRLDPAAEGEMMFLWGPDLKRKEKYLHADKEYEVEYLLGIGTDTGDLLGKITRTDFAYSQSQENVRSIVDALKSLAGKRQQLFHPFSSKVVDGKPLWMHAREGSAVTASHPVAIYDIEVLDISQAEMSEVLDRVSMILGLVSGDFRQSEIRASWNTVSLSVQPLLMLKVRILASSGTYMRVLGEELAEKIGIPVTAHGIVRTKIVS